MNPIKEFAGFEGKSYAESTRRVYRSAIKKALKIAEKPLDEYESYEELLALFRENLAQKKGGGDLGPDITLLALLDRTPGPARAEPPPPQNVGVQPAFIPKFQGRSG